MTNAKLESVKGGLALINTNITTANTNLTTLNDSVTGTNGLLEGVATMIANMVTPMTADKESEIKTGIEGQLSSTLDDTFTKYSNVLGFGSGYGSAPDNITVTLFNKKYTLLDFSFLDDYVSIIRSIFLSLAYLFGFMIFLRGGK